MSFKTYPLNNVDYTAEDAELFHCTRSSGIYAGDDFQISVTGANRYVTIGPGLSWIRNSKFSGKVAAQKEAVTLDPGISDSTYPRIDAVAIRFSAVANQTEVVVKQGVASSSPVAPALERTEAVYELHLCHIRRPAGSVVVTAADITDLRLNASYCGLMADSVTHVDTAAMEAQIKGLTNRLEGAITAVQGGAGFVSKTLLWENPSIGSRFEEQDIPISCENYDGLEIVCAEVASDYPTLISSGFVPYSVGASFYAYADNISVIFSRDFTMTPDALHVYSGQHRFDTTSVPDPGVIVPYKIYGITGILDPSVEIPPTDPIPALGDMMFDLDVDMSTSGGISFTNNEQMQKVYDNNMSIYVVYYAEVSGNRHIYRCVCPTVKDSLPIGTASSGEIVFASGLYNNHNTNARYGISLYFDPTKFAADETLEITNGSHMSILTGVTVTRVYASVF